MGSYQKLLRAISEKNFRVGIIGIGYVGYALAQAASEAGISVVGFTRKSEKAHKINSLKIPNFIATSDFSQLSACDVICVCVPTPIHEDKKPDLEPLESSLEICAKHLRNGQLIIIESTIAPGTTRSIALPILKKSALQEEKDFFLAFSPERVDPGNVQFTVTNTPKVVGGLSQYSLELVTEFYKLFIHDVIKVSSLEVAELSKILENTFRLVNISFINELVSYTKALGIDMYEVVNAAATKPYGFLPHYPGPGVGGHCIPVDPYYLIDDAQKRGITLSMVEDAGRVNDDQPKKVVAKTLDILQKTNGSKKSQNALLVGLAYKKDIDDHRESPSIKIWELLEQQQVHVSYHDPYIPTWNGRESQDLTDKILEESDVIIIATDHGNVDYKKLTSSQKPILDTRKVLTKNGFSFVYEI